MDRDEDTRLWRFTRAVARTKAVDDVLADYASSYCGRPLRRREMAHTHRATVTWSIDNEVVVEFVHEESGAGRLLVHEMSLLQPLKKELRSRHITIEYDPAS
jgi:hypothetical protein